MHLLRFAFKRRRIAIIKWKKSYICHKMQSFLSLSALTKFQKWVSTVYFHKQRNDIYTNYKHSCSNLSPFPCCYSNTHCLPATRQHKQVRLFQFQIYIQVKYKTDYLPDDQEVNQIKFGFTLSLCL